LNILAIDSSSSWGSVSIAHEGRICYLNYLDIRVTHSERLMLQIDKSLVSSGLTLNDIDLLVYSNGPGSFTGLRIGLATIKGICMAKEIPLIPLNSLYALAHNVYGCDVDIIPFIDAKMNEVYAAVYNNKMQQKTKPQSTNPQVFLESIQEKSIIIGDAVYKYPELIAQKKDILTCGLIHQNFITASSLIAIVCKEKIHPRYDFELIADLEPYYLRRSQAEINLHRENGK